MCAHLTMYDYKAERYLTTVQCHVILYNIGTASCHPFRMPAQRMLEHLLQQDLQQRHQTSSGHRQLQVNTQPIDVKPIVIPHIV